MICDSSASTIAAATDRAAAAGPMEGLLRWFLVLSKPAAERAAKLNLERQGYRVYCPRLQQPALRRGRWVERIVALFPRYLFVQVDGARQSLAPVGSTVGVAGIVRFGSQAAAVPARIVDDLIAREDPVSGLHKLDSSRKLRAGARVSLVGGSFLGLDGIFEREAGQDRVVVLLSLLGREVAVGVPSRFVVPAS
jgi:transcriptional antiterminator RfaH